MSATELTIQTALFGVLVLVIRELGGFVVRYLRNRGKINDATTDALTKIKEAKADGLAAVEESKANLVKAQQDAQAKGEELRAEVNVFIYKLAQDLLTKQDTMNQQLQAVAQESSAGREKNAALEGQLKAISARADASDKQAAEAQRLIGTAQAQNATLTDEINNLRESRRVQDAANTDLTRRVTELTTNLQHMASVQENAVKTRDTALAERDSALSEVAELKTLVASQDDKIKQQAARIEQLEGRVAELEVLESAARKRATAEHAPAIASPSISQGV